MNRVENKIAVWVKVILNQKRCSECFVSYSSKSVICEIFESLRSRSTLFAANKFNPMYLAIRLPDNDKVNRLVLCKSSARTYESAYTLRIMCQCGHYSCIDISGQ